MQDELIERYSEYSDSELMNIYLNKDGYTDEAKNALETVIDNRGGVQALKERYGKIIEKEDEKLKINDEVILLYGKAFTQNDIIANLKSDILSTTEIGQISAKVIGVFESRKKDLEINSGTVIGSILGGVIGGIIGGVLWGLQMIYSGRIFYIFGIGLLIISYGFIKFFTKQSRNNIVVLILTILSAIFAFFLGFVIYNFFGYHGPNKNLH
ncbi:hypothetical protein [Chryseobacterium sp. 3008163]|uniref:hypothetical protein n=1 Tax=Chryseobacterium sp. 3008163 TaxID=2478663 RepID=UPI000F0BE48D|nr:hypothetical protein [Chryseobacterium sp. 3008163]AYN00212.1 hypothetical protein EAG08_07615 [Chryseobacterium sp. 3008163]